MQNAPKSDSPPKWANRFLEWYCAHHLIDEIQGDLLEAFYYRYQELGMRRAKWWFIWDVIRFFRPSSFGKQQFNTNSIAMFKNYLKVSFRNFVRNKVYSSINLSGLIVGIAACLLISLHVIEEFSYDNFHPYSKDTYRVVMDMYAKGELRTKSAPIYAAVGPNLAKDFPEIVAAMRILPFGGGVYSVRQEDGSQIRFNEEKAVLADPNFFELFGFKLIDGDPKNVLSEPRQIVISESTAKRYFGNKNPIGENIVWRGRDDTKVTGVFEDFPENSHMQFDMITSLKSWEGYDEWVNNWGWYDFYTFIRLSENVDINVFRTKISQYLDEKKAESFAENNIRQELVLQPIEDIHLYSKGLSWEMGENGGAENVYFLIAIAALILIIAWVNFINLSTARAVKRAKEVGVRKVVGAGKSQLIIQFLAEAFLYNFVAVLIATGIVALLVPVINGAIEISLERTLLYSNLVILGLSLLIVAGTAISGLYPAFVLTSFKPITVIRGNLYKRKGKLGFRQVLVVFQFTASITLILGTFIVVKQLQFMRSQDLGFSPEQNLVVRGATSGSGGDDLDQRSQRFRNELLELPAVLNHAITNNIPGRENFGISGYTSIIFPDDLQNLYNVHTDDNFFVNFDIEFLAGRNFSKEILTDTAAVILNESAIRLLGFDSPDAALAEKLNPNTRREFKIIGVVNDYHQASLRDNLDPIAFFYHDGRGRFNLIKLSTNDYPDVVRQIESVWDKVYPDNPFDFFFMDEFFDRQYKSDEKFNSIFIGFAGLAIFVACIGLFGLVSFTAEQSKKEISIRKVLGASVSKVVFLLAKDYARLIFIAILIAFPLAYYLMKQWLQGYAYQTSISAGVFVMGGLLISVIAFLTVSFKSFNVANSNPVNSLRDE